NTNAVNMRSGPATSYKSYGQAKSGELAYIIGINRQWYKVIWKNTICYVRSDYMDLSEVPYENNASTKTPVFFRLGKSTGYKATVANFQKSPNYFRYEAPQPSALARSIVETAKTCLGVPYVWGGESMKGFDCSGLVYYVFQQNGVTIGRTCAKQYNVGMPIGKDDLIPGDLVFFQNTYQAGLSHVGIYIGSGEFIHASSSNGVMISKLSNSYWASHYYGARRVVT
ncbi:MAG: C40 family peptidase, partial [Oscillospiraceae bacterium]|nr:C40 family peptidase [Oscillospiraceae bacterium]